MLAARLELARHRLVVDGLTAERPNIANDWLRVQAILDLYRRVRAPERFHLFPGPQVRAYRSPSDGSVQSFWLLVPDSVAEDGPPLPVSFSVNHGKGPDFFVGRGHPPSFVFGSAVHATAFGALVVIPHLRGEERFHAVGPRRRSEQPLLHTTYVDNKLGGVNTVQTRAGPGYG